MQNALPAVVDPVPDLPEEADVLLVLGSAARVLAGNVAVRRLHVITVTWSHHCHRTCDSTEPLSLRTGNHEDALCIEDWL